MILDTNRNKYTNKYTNKYIMKTDKLHDSWTKSYDQKMQIMQNLKVVPYLQNVIIRDQMKPHFHFCENNRKIDDQGAQMWE